MPQKQDNLGSGLLGAFSPTLLKMQAGVKHSALWKKGGGGGDRRRLQKKTAGKRGEGSLARDDRREKRGKIWRVEERRGRGGESTEGNSPIVELK